MKFREFRESRYNTPPYDFKENKTGFAFHQNRPGYSDISAHLPLLEYLASKCNHGTEFGTRDGCSTCAFISGLLRSQGSLVSFDVEIPSFIDDFKSMAGLDCSWEFRQKNTIDEDFKIDRTDLLFIDSLHTYQQVKNELRLHAKMVDKFIVFHDTYSHGKLSKDVEGSEGILRAITEFVSSQSEWEEVYNVDFNHGLIVLEKSL